MGKNQANFEEVKSDGELNENQRVISSSKEGKGTRLWKKVKYQLVEYHSLPGYLKDNEYILGHYRSEWPLRQVLLSVFTIHNETLNVWTPQTNGLMRFVCHRQWLNAMSNLRIWTIFRVACLIDRHNHTRIWHHNSIDPCFVLFLDYIIPWELYIVTRHLIGFFLFLCLTIYTAMKVPAVVDIPTLQNLPNVLRKADFQKLRVELTTCLPSLRHMRDWHIMGVLSNCLPERFSHINHTDVCVLRSMKEDLANIIAPLMVRPITRWPFFAFLGGAMFCLLASSTCHLLSCHSKRVSYILLRLDYAGIAALISTSFYPPVYYSFMCYPLFCNLYMGFITMLGIGTILVSLLPVFQNPEYRKFRALLFLAMGLSGVAPILHKLILFWNHPVALHTTGYEILMGSLYGLGALVYTTRVPERWMPGKFDIAGHSHQLFHVLVVAGAYTHYQAGLVYIRWRDLQGC